MMSRLQELCCCWDPGPALGQENCSCQPGLTSKVNLFTVRALPAKFIAA